MGLVVVVGRHWPLLIASDGPQTAQLCRTRLTAGTLDAARLSLN